MFYCNHIQITKPENIYRIVDTKDGAVDLIPESQVAQALTLNIQVVGLILDSQKTPTQSSGFADTRLMHLSSPNSYAMQVDEVPQYSEMIICDTQTHIICYRDDKLEFAVPKQNYYYKDYDLLLSGDKNPANVYTLAIQYVIKGNTYISTYYIANHKVTEVSSLLGIDGNSYQDSPTPLPLGYHVKHIISALTRHVHITNEDIHVKALKQALDISKIYDISVFDPKTLEIVASRYGDTVTYRVDINGRIGEK